MKAAGAFVWRRGPVWSMRAARDLERVVVLVLGGLAACGCSQRQMDRQSLRLDVGGESINCLIYVPQDYDRQDRCFLLVLFLHGAGECGDDLEKVAAHGLPHVLENGKAFPFIVVAPQSRDGGWDPEMLIALLDHVATRYRIDQDRIYVTGLSMGGFGTWALAAAYPEGFAAAVPICGGGDPGFAERLKDLPIWVFHGAEDDVVPLSCSEAMVDALEAAGGKVEFTVYRKVGHDCWRETYQNTRLYEWLLGQRRGAARP